jgi:hypothetical protein
MPKSWTAIGSIVLVSILAIDICFWYMRYMLGNCYSARLSSR